MATREKAINNDTESSSRPAQKLPPATPIYVLRGHANPIHSLNFYRMNSRLISGDAEGWVVVWDTASKRAVASWKAHDAAILSAAGVDIGHEKRILTHGRDHKLCVWRLDGKDEDIVGKILPIDAQNASQQRSDPWLLHSLSVNALNFCSFDYCVLPPKQEQTENTSTSDKGAGSTPPAQILLAIPNALNTGGLDIFHLPSEKRLCVISPSREHNTGMVMALEIYTPSQKDAIYIISGYEDGRAMVHGCRLEESPWEQDSQLGFSWTWELLYMSSPHSQPILSLDITPASEKDHFYTSSADALIVKHPIPKLCLPAEPGVINVGDPVETQPLRVINTKHSGQQGLKIRSDNKIFATAGWDSRIRVYSCRTMKELAVLKWHKEGCYSIAFADVRIEAKELDIAGGTADPALVEKSEGGTCILSDKPGSLFAIKQQRATKAQLTHWLAAGSKDGKISLWDIY